jgi:leucyl-tRNA synthetase
LEIWLKRLSGFNGAYTEAGKLINSGQFDGKDSESVKKLITEHAKGKWVNTYKLRNWVFSRQRYWGEPIPVIHCDNCGVVAVPEKDLPVKLPKVDSYEPTGTGESPLAGIEKWVNTKCPNCKGKAQRETNTMPQWAGSSWYYLRYMDPKNNKNLVSPENESYWSPVDLYVGGAEHATRHLIYARFWHKFLYDIGAVTTIEPFNKLQHVGLIMGEDGRKMSKRFGNVVNPDDIVAQFGADTMRVYEMFMGPFDQQIAWSTDSMVGARRFIERVWKISAKVSSDAIVPKTVESLLHRTIKKVTEDIQAIKLNTAISSLMITLNEFEKLDSIPQDIYLQYLQLLAPFAPHMTDELWSMFGNKDSIHVSDWPTYDPLLLVDKEVKIVVQVNGKVRASITVQKGTNESLVRSTAEKVEEVAKWLADKKIEKCIYIPDKLINFVVV